MSFLRRLKAPHLRLIQLIAEREQLQVAAEAMGLSQPAASRALAEIEREVGGQLFHRHPRGMAPTELGAACLRHARVILAGFDSLESEMRDLNRGTSGEVRIGTVTGPAVGSVVPAVQAVKAAAPGIRVSVEVGPSTQLVRALQDGMLDFALARLPPGVASGEFELHPARRETAALVVRQTHPLAGRRRVSLADMLDYQWVIQEPDSPIRQAVEAAFLEAELPVPANVTNSSSLLVALAMVAQGDVIAPLSQEVAGLLTSGDIAANLVTLDPENRISVSPYYVISHRDRQLTMAASRLLTETLSRL